MSRNSYNIRPYTQSDHTACLGLFDSNTPRYFAPEERRDFESFLDRTDATMLVLETAAGELIGCGGYDIRDGGEEGALAWGMIARDWHRRGAGGTLLRARLSALQTAGATEVTLRTSQHSRGFFEREGFTEIGVVQDGFAPGIDMVELRLRPLFRNPCVSGMFQGSADTAHAAPTVALKLRDEP